MDLTQVTILALLGFFRIISGNVSTCTFGENCIYPCHCQDDAVCDGNDGSCPDGCDDGDIRQPGDYWYTGAWSGYGCQLGNVAFEKSATQSWTYLSHVASKAVDGGHNPVFEGSSCAHPGSYDTNLTAWWQVDLGTIYVVLSINITNIRHSFSSGINERRTAYINIFVSETRDEDTMENLCYAVGDEGSMPYTYVNCTQPMKGQYVKLIRQTGDDVYQHNWMNFCEVEVYGYLYYDCPDNHFGVACGTACNCQDPCDTLNGVCSSEHCLGGWNGSNCQTPCVDGKWGANCPNDCHCMDEEEPCDRVNGQCSSGCDMAYRGLSCNLAEVGDKKADHAPTIAIVVVTLAVIAILLAVSVLLIRRYMRRKLDTNKESTGKGAADPAPYAEIGYDNPSDGCGNLSQNTYEDIVEDVKPVSMNSKTQPKGNNETKQSLEGVAIDEPVQKLREHPLYQNENTTERPIPLTELASYINHMAKAKDGFKKDFEKIRNSLYVRPGDSEESEYEQLTPTSSNVIDNTNYVNTDDISNHRENPKGYIALGVPPNSAANDFWNMVWETESRRIVMLSSLQSQINGKSQYEDWPAQGTTNDGEFEVSLVNETKVSYCTIKTLSVAKIKRGQARSIYSYHFTGWPEYGVPEVATSLLDFRRKVRNDDNIATGPLIVLSDFDDGRAGTFIALDCLLTVSKNDGAIDVVKFVNDVTSGSAAMIQTVDQYEFVYRGLLEAFQVGDTLLTAMDLQLKYPDLKQTNATTGESRLQAQFSLLERLKPQQEIGGREGALQPENASKNRDQSITPLDKYRPLLRSYVNGTTDYINAVFIDGYCQRHAYIATQLPVPFALADIWRLVYDHNCCSIIALDRPDNDDMMTPTYWPTKKEKPFVIAQLRVTLLKEEIHRDVFSIIELEIALDNKNPRKVRLYQFLDWPVGQDTPTSLDSILQLLDHVGRWEEHSGFYTTTFVCKYGFQRCGLMIAACYILEKLRMENEVDIFQAVKQVRIPRPELVISLGQYECLHELVIAHIDSCEEYSNFK